MIVFNQSGCFRLYKSCQINKPDFFLQKCVLKRQRNHENAVSKLVVGSGEQDMILELYQEKNLRSSLDSKRKTPGLETVK